MSATSSNLLSAGADVFVLFGPSRDGAAGDKSSSCRRDPKPIARNGLTSNQSPISEASLSLAVVFKRPLSSFFRRQIPVSGFGDFSPGNVGINLAAGGGSVRGDFRSGRRHAQQGGRPDLPVEASSVTASDRPEPSARAVQSARGASAFRFVRAAATCNCFDSSRSDPFFATSTMSCAREAAA